MDTKNLTSLILNALQEKKTLFELHEICGANRFDYPDYQVNPLSNPVNSILVDLVKKGEVKIVVNNWGGSNPSFILGRLGD